MKDHLSCSYCGRSEERHNCPLLIYANLIDAMGDVFELWQDGRCTWSAFQEQLAIDVKELQEWQDQNRTYLPNDQQLDAHLDCSTARLTAA